MVILLLIIDRARRADLRAHAALAVFEHVAVVRGRSSQPSAPPAQTGCKSRGGCPCPRLNSFGTFFCGHFSVHAPQPVQTSSLTKRALRRDLHMEIADEAAHLFDLRVGVDVNFFVLRAVDHFRGQNARRAVKRRERLVDLRHLAADGRLLLDDIDLKTGLRDIECRLNARDAAADDKRPLRNGAGSGGQRRVKVHLCDRGSA